MKWIKCEDKLPPMPKEWLDENEYLTAKKVADEYAYQVLSYVDGWNCSLMHDGRIDKTHEIKGIVAWAEIPEFED